MGVSSSIADTIFGKELREDEIKKKVEELFAKGDGGNFHVYGEKASHQFQLTLVRGSYASGAPRLGQRYGRGQDIIGRAKDIVYIKHRRTPLLEAAISVESAREEEIVIEGELVDDVVKFILRRYAPESQFKF